VIYISHGTYKSPVQNLGNIIMKVYSFIKKGVELHPIEVEVSLVPGLPGIQILGQADGLIKESEPRVKSALRHQGFELPQSQRILINLRPSYLKKSSRGLELAMACAILWKTGQVEIPDYLKEVQEIFVYGELSLEGQVIFSEDLRESFFDIGKEKLITGLTCDPCNFDSYGLSELRQLVEPTWSRASDTPYEFKRPELDKSLLFNKKSAELLTLLAVGEHSILLAGPAGSGKTTMAEAYHSLIKEPNSDDIQVSLKMSKLMGRDLQWRPFVSPHHTTTPLAIIGGGQKIFPGEISRAHHGILLLDEYLEFNPRVQEALREPLEKGVIHITRMGNSKTFPADFTLVATTNLCPCGDLVPGKFVSCQRSLIRCRSYIEKLSGPVLDRFDLLSMSTGWRETCDIGIEEIYKSVQDAQEFALERRDQAIVNSKLTEQNILEQCDDFVKTVLLPDIKGSRRRRRSVLRVARSLADMESSELIKPTHMGKAISYCVTSFDQIKKIFA